MVVTATFPGGSNGFDPFYHNRTQTLTKFGFALQKGRRITVGSGGAQFVRPAPAPALATNYQFEDESSSSSGACPTQSSSGPGEGLPGQLWEAAAGTSWSWLNGIFQFTADCDDEVTVKFEFE